MNIEYALLAMKYGGVPEENLINLKNLSEQIDAELIEPELPNAVRGKASVLMSLLIRHLNSIVYPGASFSHPDVIKLAGYDVELNEWLESVEKSGAKRGLTQEDIGEVVREFEGMISAREEITERRAANNVEISGAKALDDQPVSDSEG